MNSKTGKKVNWEDIIKAYQYDKNTLIPVNEEEIKYVAGESARTIEIENFIASDNINLIDIDKTYYLVPEKKGTKGYVILRDALKESKKMGIAKVTISTKEYVAAIGCYRNALLLYILRYPNEIKDISDFSIPSDAEVKVTKKEIQIATQLIKSMSSKWRPEKYKDRYAEIVHKWAKQKIKNKKFLIEDKKIDKSENNNIINFEDLLKQSLKNKSAHKKNNPAKNRKHG